MVARLALLILCWLIPGAVLAAEPRCLSCHAVHYAELGGCRDCHRGDPRSSRLEIAHFGLIPARYSHFRMPDSGLVERGGKRIDETGCRRCHVIGGRGNRLATDLDRSVQTSTPQELAESIRRPVLFMPDFHWSEPHLDEVINALFAAGKDGKSVEDELPRIVHFEVEGTAEENPFVKHCGSCHRVLTAAAGGLGSSDYAPNLSGLLTPFFPVEYRENEPFNRDNLKKYLDNPRQTRALTRMAPVPLKEEDYRKLLDVIAEDVSTIPPEPTLP
ncbi:selenite/tellurite reduction operon c-type cytochrome lipoprotein ExtS [Trichloromonas acetexigens]|uniref:Cytochrome c n=1 Tax=Trichloromonas acetexigens TaxID=38815 RepID=A0A550JB66_9BACT|nr:selenite/tellurite reduction operon c-type cytochrome lipoprotein ExtS [Desulfuromonas acetexigens]TRO80509.1 cytochrome c [Desulfuromonas acetexigens]